MNVSKWVWFDVGYGNEKGRIESINEDNTVTVNVPCDGPRRLAMGDVYDDPDAVEEAEFALPA